MDSKVTGRVSQRPSQASFSWNRQPSATPIAKVCTFWLAGNCTKYPCRFLHQEPVAPAPIGYDPLLKRSSGSKESFNHGNGYISSWKQLSGSKESCGSEKVAHKRTVEGSNGLHRKQKTCGENVVEKSSSCSVTASKGIAEKRCLKICDYWMKGNCFHGEKCNYLHSWSHGNGFSMLARLEGHKKAVNGITLPSGSDKLFTGSKDGTLRVWNCHTGENVGEVDMGAAVGCLISEGPWVLVGIANFIKAWNIQSDAQLTVRIPAGQVYSMCVANGLLFSGVEDGSVLVWKFNSEMCSFEMTASLKGHTGAVVSLSVGLNRLYSGSVDNTIRVWDLDKLQCINTLNKHSEVVMSMVCCDQYLLSCSLDRSLKVWAATETGELEVAYTHNEEHGILALCGMHDAEEKPILLCACNDNTVRLYELPSFVLRGQIFTKQEVRSLQIGPGGIFFTGDGTGLVSVWRLVADSTTTVLSVNST